MNIFEELQQRDLIQDMSDSEAISKLPTGTYCYVGFDPTARSLHLGNLVPLLTALRLGLAGFKPILLFGGATGFIGDPSGKSSERNLLDQATIEANVLSQIAQVKKITSRLNVTVEFVNNYDWTKNVSVIEFLRDIGKYLTVNYMLDKDSVNSRLSGAGLSFTEFSYMLLQAMDFLHLYKTRNCKLQFGGSDQWGNITAGLELIRKKEQGQAYAFSMPLLTRPNGQKFGKSEEGAIWLNCNDTSPYQLHQYLLNVTDAEVIKLLKVLSFLSLDEIKTLEQELQSAPEKRQAQQALANHLCDLIHGKDETIKAQASAKVLFGGSMENLADATLLQIFSEVPASEIRSADLSLKTLVDVFSESGLCSSKADAKRLFKNGGAYLNNERINDTEITLDKTSVSQRSFFVLRSGKKSYHLFKII